MFNSPSFHAIFHANPAGATPLQWLVATLRRRAAPAAPRDRVREAAEVRALADSVRRTDRRFADDLNAAADRHEALGG